MAADAEEGGTAAMALAWAFAMVRSRAFVAEDDRFAFVPFMVREIAAVYPLDACSCSCKLYSVMCVMLSLGVIMAES